MRFGTSVSPRLSMVTTGEEGRGLTSCFSSSDPPPFYQRLSATVMPLGVSVSLGCGDAAVPSFALLHFPADHQVALESALTCTNMYRHNSPGSF
ncbi:hypothetical protein NDU88_002520 [Pleurodeles waltl]|uniref:Uncharacterized protein n=1 Tax=Pleurodeles waltl TaxID=8319 RepID=A0AAV7Q936_PLEWA|nr:hypothetical protein NDU88_002520 [Pleurodeles waltl]